MEGDLICFHQNVTVLSFCKIYHILVKISHLLSTFSLDSEEFNLDIKEIHQQRILSMSN